MRVILLILLVSLLSACYDTGEFFEDVNEPRLPMFTAKGNNAAGVYFDDEVWTSVYIYQPSFLSRSESFQDIARFYILNDSAYLGLSGIKLKTGVLYMYLFNLGVYEEFDFSNISRMKGRPLDLNKYNTKILTGDTVYNQYNDTIGTVLHGKLLIGETYYKNDEEEKNILAGTFGFDALIGKDTVNIHSGRFDFESGNYFIREIDSDYAKIDGLNRIIK